MDVCNQSPFSYGQQNGESLNEYDSCFGYFSAWMAEREKQVQVVFIKVFELIK
jgi:hypothetical protein